MKKDTLIKTIFILLLLISIYFIISGLMTNEETNNQIMEEGLQLSSTNVEVDVDMEY